MNYLKDKFTKREMEALEIATARLRRQQPPKKDEQPKPKDLGKWARLTVERAIIMNGGLAKR